MTKARRAASEPLLHFLVLGASLFVFDALTAGGAREIVISEGRVRSLLQSFEIVWQRPPTEVELRSLVEDYVREEVFYREAIAMGLDEDDAFIRRRLREKMELLAEESSALYEPMDEELERFLARDGTGARTADLPEIRDRVRREWISTRRREASEAFYRSLREKYRVTIELDDGETRDGSLLAR